MKVGDYVVGNSLHQRLANVKGKISTQFMSGGLHEENPFRKGVEESVRMGGYEINFRKTKKVSSERPQSMTGYSEFWIS